MAEVLQTVLELVAVALLTAGVGLVAAALVGGLLGAGVGLVAAALMMLAAAEVARRVHTPVESEVTSS